MIETYVTANALWSIGAIGFAMGLLVGYFLGSLNGK